jgi:integrase
MLLRRIGRGDLTAHGFHSSFRDWASDKTTFLREVAETALAHAVGDKTERAYRREKARDKRRKLMDVWAAYCVRYASNVFEFRKVGGSAA